jgi:uroporphyrinogen-III decarboxylase
MTGDAVTAKQRFLGAMVGQTLDRFPVAAPYIFLLQCDHWCELTGQPAWTYHTWLAQDPEEHVKVYADFQRQLPFDLLQPQTAPSRAQRQAWEVVHRDAKHYFRDRRSGALQWMNEDLAHMAAVANQTQFVFDQADVRERVRVRPAQEILESGVYDHISQAARAYGAEQCLMNGVVGTFWQCHWYVGETNLFAMLYDAPELITYLSEWLLERTIEDIRALAAAGDDVIYIDDALTTNDLVSVAFYERFSMPYVRRMVQEIHALGKKAVVIYFGGVADRLAQISSLGADALSVETSMKSYVNDLDNIARQVDGGLVLWGNIDPVGVVQNGSDEDLAGALASQAQIGRRMGQFIMSTGSPITPLTPLRRICRFIELARQAGQKVGA